MSPRPRNRLSLPNFAPFDWEQLPVIDEITCGPDKMKGKYHFANRDKNSNGYFFVLMFGCCSPHFFAEQLDA